MVSRSPGSPADAARDWARSGVLPLTGHSTGSPLVPVGDAASWAGRMADHLELATRDSRHPVRIDGARLLSERAALSGSGRRGRLSVGGSCRLLPTLDGWAAVSSARPDDPLLWSALIGRELDERLPERLADWLAAHSGAELDERAELLSLAAGSVRALGQHAGCAGYAGYAGYANGADSADHADRTDGTDGTDGTDRAESADGTGDPDGTNSAGNASKGGKAGSTNGAGGADSTDRRRERLWPGRPRSVEGLLVVDFSALWAGPLCAHLLGLAGADVVKVEIPSRPDGARLGNRAFYDLLHGGHRSVALDPADPAERAALHALVRRADIVIEASRPRALARFGLDARAEVARGCTWVSITACGRASDRVGFGDDVAAANGLLAYDGQGLPVFCGDAIADPLTGLTAAALALTEPEGGGGMLWDVAMADVVAATVHAGATAPEPRAEQAGTSWSVADVVAPTVHAGAAAPEARAEQAGTGWVVDTGEERVPVAAPMARTPLAAASELGADTGAVLRQFGICAP